MRFPFPETDPQNTSQPLCLSWPPEIETTYKQYDCPRRSQFYDAGARVTREKFSVKVEEHAHGTLVFVYDVKNREGLRIHIDTTLVVPDSDDDARCGIGVRRQFVVVERGMWNRSHSGERDLLRRGSIATQMQMVVRAIQPSFDLRLEEVDGSCAGQPDDKGDAEDPRVEVPSPYGTVEPSTLFVPLFALCCAAHDASFCGGRDTLPPLFMDH
jgi:hypothetical protein